MRRYWVLPAKREQRPQRTNPSRSIYVMSIFQSLVAANLTSTHTETNAKDPTKPTQTLDIRNHDNFALARSEPPLTYFTRTWTFESGFGTITCGSQEEQDYVAREIAQCCMEAFSKLVVNYSDGNIMKKPTIQALLRHFDQISGTGAALRVLGYRPGFSQNRIRVLHRAETVAQSRLQTCLHLFCRIHSARSASLKAADRVLHNPSIHHSRPKSGV